ncbi:MAG TPA: LptF/LptG family permease [Gemmatimonadaceae bacterium]|nr:LptF/LptG family permease [Gemmatimonadaceae bacterium]
MKKLLHPLDRYVLSEFWKIFIPMALGFPLLVIVIDLVDHLDTYLNRNLTNGQIALSYLYWIPDSMFMVLPAAVLFATVFSIGALTRHSEVTAAKASGISFYRLVAPIFLGASMVTLFALVLGEVVPVTNAKRNEILEERSNSASTDRFNFAYEAPHGRVYQVAALNVKRNLIDQLAIERKGSGPEYPTYLLAARSAQWDTTAERWTIKQGNLHIIPDSSQTYAIHFDSLRDRNFDEAPADLTLVPRSPEEMRYSELSRFIAALERSGGDVNELKVERALKIAIPITCLIIAIFGAPLATSTQRGGAAYGIGISLATTVLFLMLIQITKAVGGGGVIPPTIAAWLPNALFGVLGIVLLAKVRT